MTRRKIAAETIVVTLALLCSSVAYSENVPRCHYELKHPGYRSDDVLEAVRKGDADRLGKLIRWGADIGTEDATYGGVTPLLMAVYHQRRDIVRLLINCGADVNASNDLGFSPLMVASAFESGKTMTRLLEAGADPRRSSDNGETALRIAISCVSAKNAGILLATRELLRPHIDATLVFTETLLEESEKKWQGRSRGSALDTIRAMEPDPVADYQFENLCSFEYRDPEALQGIEALLKDAVGRSE